MKGLENLKVGWGPIEKPLHYYFLSRSYHPNSKVKLIKDKFVTPIIKSSPEFVCRAIGELIYKFFPSA